MPASLFEPGRIGPVEIRNRVIMASMTTRCADAEGFVTPNTIAYYKARAEGGVGLITVEMAAPEKCGRHRRFELGLYDDRFLPGLTELVKVIHASGAKASIQLGHGGGHTRVDICGEAPIAPSAIPHVVQEFTTETIIPEAMTPERIEQTIAAHVAAAVRAKAAGFDAVEIHSAHGYLLSQFHTPFENRRTDEWGGSLRNRARFSLEITRRVKEAVPDLAVIFRITVDDFFPEGLRLEDGVQIAAWAAEGGADAIHVAAGHYRSLPSSLGMIPPMAKPEGSFLPFARAVKPRVKIPVIAVARLGNPELAASALAEGTCDFIALGRPLLADEKWVAKAEAGQPVRRCLACNTCINIMREGNRLQCLVNARTGREIEFSESAEQPTGKRIAVIGAGPAGLSYASLVAADNTVTIFERKHRAGGSLRQAALAPRFQDVESAPDAFERYFTSLVRTCETSGVTLTYGTDVLKKPALLADFDMIVIASGAKYRFGLGPFAAMALESGVARWPLPKRLFDREDVRNWLYYKARVSTGRKIAKLARPGQEVVIIGDAASAGKSQAAISQAFEAALLGRHKVAHA
ncbi:NAD(P)-binding protein [Leptospira interrogans]